MGHAVQITETMTFEREDCITCGITFFVQASLQAECKLRPRSFYCPNGHSMIYNGGEIKKLRDEAAALKAKLEAETKRKEWAEQATKQERERADKAEKATRRLKKRVAAGVCPCCHRTVSQMARHMKTKHPDYASTSEVSKDA